MFGGGGNGGGSGGGQGGGMDWMSLLNMAGQANDNVVQSITAPYQMRRERVLALAPNYLSIGQGLQPVARTPGALQMAHAAALERANPAYGLEQGSLVDRKIRDAGSRAAIIHDSVGIARKLAEYAVGAYGAAGGGAAGGGGASAGAAGYSADVPGGASGGAASGGMAAAPTGAGGNSFLDYANQYMKYTNLGGGGGGGGSGNRYRYLYYGF